MCSVKKFNVAITADVRPNPTLEVRPKPAWLRLLGKEETRHLTVSAVKYIKVDSVSSINSTDVFKHERVISVDDIALSGPR